MERYTHEQIKAAKDALVIVDPGACNLTGVALALHEAGKAWLHARRDTHDANTSAPVRLILDQLLNLAFKGRVSIDSDEFHEAYEECKAIVASVEKEDACLPETVE